MTASPPLCAQAQRLVDQINAATKAGDAGAIRRTLANCALAVDAGEISASDGEAVVSAARAGNKTVRAAAQQMRLELRLSAALNRQPKLEQATSIRLMPDQFERIDQANLGTQLLAALVPPKSRKSKA